MRKGINPNKDEKITSNNFFHQIIIPVYIPNNDNYFKDSFTILKYCLESLFKTCHDKTFITIINNGSYIEISQYLDDLYSNGKIHEIIHTENIGKLNAILKGIVGQNFPLITITDSDVLFLENWQNETYKVFDNFPKTGVVCPTPSSKSFNYNTFNILFELFFSKNLRFSTVKNPEALKNFAKSIGNPSFYNETHFQKYLVVKQGEFKAVVGAGHFVATYRNDVFKTIEITHSNFALGGDSESNILDLPSLKKGLWRLSTSDNFAYHLGNVSETWMNNVVSELKKNDEIIEINYNFKSKKVNSLEFWIKNIFFQKLIYKKGIRKLFLRYKGLSKEQATHY